MSTTLKFPITLLIVAACGKAAPPTGMGVLGDEAITGWTKMCTAIGGAVTQDSETLRKTPVDVWTCRHYPGHDSFFAALALDHSSRRLMRAGGMFRRVDLQVLRDILAPALDKAQLTAADWLFASSGATVAPLPNGEGHYDKSPGLMWRGHGALLSLTGAIAPSLDDGFVSIDFDGCPNCE